MAHSEVLWSDLVALVVRLGQGNQVALVGQEQLLVSERATAHSEALWSDLVAKMLSGKFPSLSVLWNNL
jgi:tRNA(Arg) A34 adenosine deaminase TadA